MAELTDQLPRQHQPMNMRWCFHYVLLAKAFESPGDCSEVHNPKLPRFTTQISQFMSLVLIDNALAVGLSVILTGVVNVAWGHLISWYKQMHDVSLSVEGNCVVNSINLLYISREKVLYFVTLKLSLHFITAELLR